MKKLALLFLVLPLLFVACSDDDKDEQVEYNETVGYLTNLTSVKAGIVGLWKLENASSYAKYGGNNIRYSGSSISNLSNEAKFEVFKNNGNFILRAYAIGDLAGTGSYVDEIITKLSKDSLTLYYSRDDKEYKYGRVIE